MALQMETHLIGRVGDMVYFKRGGGFFARTQAANVRQSAATKASSGNFGLASACGKNLRQQLGVVLPFPKDRIMQARFAGAITKWLGAGNAATLPATTLVPYVTGFAFNAATSIAERWHLPLVVDQPDANELALHIPAFTPTQCMAAPAHTVTITCTIAVAGSMLLHSAATGNYTISFDISYNDVPVAARVVNLPVATPARALLVTAISLLYKLDNGKYYSLPAFMPASVVDARYKAVTG